MLLVYMTVAAILRFLRGGFFGYAMPDDAMTFETPHLLIVNVPFVQFTERLEVDTAQFLEIVAALAAHRGDLRVADVDFPVAVTAIDVLLPLEEVRMGECLLSNGNRPFRWSVTRFAIVGFLMSRTSSVKMTEETCARRYADMIGLAILMMTCHARQIPPVNHGIVVDAVIEVDLFLKEDIGVFGYCHVAPDTLTRSIGYLSVRLGVITVGGEGNDLRKRADLAFEVSGESGIVMALDARHFIVGGMLPGSEKYIHVMTGFAEHRMLRDGEREAAQVEKCDHYSHDRTEKGSAPRK
jgi:hypothetical protein